MGWRLITTGLADSYFVTAADEALITLRTQDLIPNTLHFYRRNQPTISIGRSRRLDHDINLPYCQQHHIPLIRRTTGGGTIYTDPGCLIYSLVFDHTDIAATTSIDIFSTICTHIVKALQELNINASYKPPNDIHLSGKKISGSGILKKNQRILVHGTLLHSTDLTTMRHALKQPLQTTPVTTLINEHHTNINIKDIQNALIQQFASLFNTTFNPSPFTQKEKALIDNLIQTRYSQPQWNTMR